MGNVLVYDVGILFFLKLCIIYGVGYCKKGRDFAKKQMRNIA